VYGQTTAHVSNLLDLSGGARLEHEDGSTVFAGAAPSATTRTNGGVFAEARATLHRVSSTPASPTITTRCSSPR
jgi:hypothetical protein